MATAPLLLLAMTLGWQGPGGAPAPSGGGAAAPASPRLPEESAGEIATIEAAHRAELSGPIESWRLEGVRLRYEALRGRVREPASLAAIDARLALVARHEAMARSAREFAALLARSRSRDQEVESTRRVLADLDRPGRRAFVAEGLFQPSSRQVDGRRVYALIGDDGAPIAYLDVPAGLDARPMLAKRVGVRGAVRYNEDLRSRLIAVRDLEPIE